MEHKQSRLDMNKFEALVSTRFKVAGVLTVIMLGIYYGFILILAFDKEIFSVKIGEHMNLWIPIGIGVILSAWVLTGVYVAWANSKYDSMVKELKDSMRW